MAQRRIADVPSAPGGDADSVPEAEAWAVFDAESRRLLGVPGEEFLRRWDAGDYDGMPEDDLGRRVNGMVFLLLWVSPERVDAGRGRRTA